MGANAEHSTDATPRGIKMSPVKIQSMEFFGKKKNLKNKIFQFIHLLELN